ncbi:hypothetical protein HYV86_01335 [Candidatus Woesearchaeota archaeon]|nr:hypothetical protein [Candidatus Woesearchaeota archaeon]
MTHQRGVSLFDQIVQEYQVPKEKYELFHRLVSLTFPFFFKESPHYQGKSVFETQQDEQTVRVSVIYYWRTKDDYYTFRRCNPLRLQILESKLEMIVLKEKN